MMISEKSSTRRRLFIDYCAFESDPWVGDFDEFSEFVDVSVTVTVEVDVSWNV